MAELPREPGRDAGREPAGAGLVVRPEPYDSPVARRLAAALEAELDERYAGDPDPCGTPELMAVWGVRPEQVVPPAGTFLVAWLDREPVGCGAVRPMITGEPGVAEVKRMYTAPSARRRGVSRAVLTALEDAARRLGYRRLQLETGVRQPEAIALYESAGWHRIPAYGQYAADPLSVCFAKDLDAGPAHEPGSRHASADQGAPADQSASSGPGGPVRAYHSQP
ncbi:MAG TPA: GNAT family N-acetyltransferase [Acidimicrobiales bacterium]